MQYSQAMKTTIGVHLCQPTPRVLLPVSSRRRAATSASGRLEACRVSTAACSASTCGCRRCCSRQRLWQQPAAGLRGVAVAAYPPAGRGRGRAGKGSADDDDDDSDGDEPTPEEIAALAEEGLNFDMDALSDSLPAYDSEEEPEPGTDPEQADQIRSQRRINNSLRALAHPAGGKGTPETDEQALQRQVRQNATAALVILEESLDEMHTQVEGKLKDAVEPEELEPLTGELMERLVDMVIQKVTQQMSFALAEPEEGAAAVAATEALEAMAAWLRPALRGSGPLDINQLAAGFQSDATLQLLENLREAARHEDSKARRAARAAERANPPGEYDEDAGTAASAEQASQAGLSSSGGAMPWSASDTDRQAGEQDDDEEEGEERNPLLDFLAAMGELDAMFGSQAGENAGQDLPLLVEAGLRAALRAERALERAMAANTEDDSDARGLSDNPLVNELVYETSLAANAEHILGDDMSALDKFALFRAIDTAFDRILAPVKAQRLAAQLGGASPAAQPAVSTESTFIGQAIEGALGDTLARLLQQDEEGGAEEARGGQEGRLERVQALLLEVQAAGVAGDEARVDALEAQLLDELDEALSDEQLLALAESALAVRETAACAAGLIDSDEVDAEEAGDGQDGQQDWQKGD